MNRQTKRFQNILRLVLTLDRRAQRVLQMGFDALAVFGALAGAIVLRLETFTFLDRPEFFISYALILIPTLFLFAKMGLYRAFIRYVSTEIALLVALGSVVSAILVIVAKLLLAPFIPWSIPIIFGALQFIALTGLRFTMRAIFRATTEKRRKHLAIYGAGAAGAQLLQSLASNAEYRVQMILDDNPQLQGQLLYGLRVMSFEEAVDNFEALDVDIVLLAMPSVEFATKQKIIARVNEYALEVKTIPAVGSLIDGSAQITEFNDVVIEDLLGRERVEPIAELMCKNIKCKSVLVTGAGGSIGRELCRQIIQRGPKQLLLLDVSEIAVYTIAAELDAQAEQLGVTLVPLVGGVQDRLFIAATLAERKVDTIYHTAAYKHVPLMEQNILQAIKNNTIGTLVLADEAVNASVPSFTLISTDKAVNPTNIMGASKRLAERICQAKNFEQQMTRFSMVRFGNVLGSSGSVVPLFQKQIATGGPITLTHPDVIRYFMTIDEAVQLVIQANAMAKGGEVFVLDMGTPVRIKDLAFKMVQLSGMRPYIEGDVLGDDGDIAIRITGLRPGEKMYEELSYGDNLIGTKHPRIMTAHEIAMTKQEIVALIEHLEMLIATQDRDGLVECLARDAGYTASNVQSKLTANAFTSPQPERDGDNIVTWPRAPTQS